MPDSLGARVMRNTLGGRRIPVPPPDGHPGHGWCAHSGNWRCKERRRKQQTEETLDADGLLR